MNKAVLSAGIVILGILTLLLVNIIQSYATGNELDYNLLKDTTEAAMIDSVDLGYYRLTGMLRIDKDSFVESFVRRFAASVKNNRDYNIKIYDINEVPPKVSIRVGSRTDVTFDAADIGIVNSIDAILETKYDDNKTLNDYRQNGVNTER